MEDSNGIAYQRGRFLPVEEVNVSILDPAFSKSDVVFDVVSVWDGRFFRLEDHLRRFRESREYVRMKSPYSEDEMKQILAQCVDRAGLSEAMVYMLCTRGSYTGGGAIGDPRSCENEFIAYSHPYYWVVPRERVKTGVHLWLAETCRAPNSAINQKTKSFNRMDLTRAQFEALDAGADAPVLPSTDGFLTEGPGFNLWIVKDGRVLTPGDNMLEGITRRTVFELCSLLDLEATTANLTAEDLQKSEEAFISTTGGGIVPVTRVSERAIGDGTPGQISCTLRDLYWAKRAEDWHTTSVSGLLSSSAESLAGTR